MDITEKILKEKYIVLDDFITDKNLLKTIEVDPSFFPKPKKIATNVVNLVHAKERAPVDYTFWPGWLEQEEENPKHSLIRQVWEDILPIAIEDVYGFEYWSRTFLPGQYSMWHFDRGFGRGIEKTINYIFSSKEEHDNSLSNKSIYYIGKIFSTVRCAEATDDKFMILDGEIRYGFDYDFKQHRIILSDKNIYHFTEGIIKGYKDSEFLFGINNSVHISEIEEAQKNMSANDIKKFLKNKYYIKNHQEKLSSIDSSDRISRCLIGCVYYPHINDPKDITSLQMMIDDDIIEVQCKQNRLIVFDSATIFHQTTPSKTSIRYSMPINVWSKKNPPSKLDQYYFNYNVD